MHRLLRLSYLSLSLITMGAASRLGAAPASGLEWLDPYNVEWTGAGKGSGDSMPCGGGDIGLNVWIEGDDLLLYADRSGNIDENDQQLKSGRFRLHLGSGMLGQAGIRQRLVLRDGCVLIEGEGLKGKVWVEVARPVIHVEFETTAPRVLEAAYESWRTQTKLVPRTREADGKPSGWDTNRWSMFGYFWYNGEVRSYADSLGFASPTEIEFVHQNNNQDLIFDKEVKLQRLGKASGSMFSPSRDRIFGGHMAGDALVSGGKRSGTYMGTPFEAWVLKSAAPSVRHHLRVSLNTEITPSLATWRSHLGEFVRQRKGRDQEAWAENQAWWRAFWERSRVVINAGRGAGDTGWRIGRNYQLFRYQLACNARGEFPTRFNGGLFTFDPCNVYHIPGDESFVNPDYRAWGAWTGQNQRLVHWPMLRNGDFEMMLPQFEFYRRNLPNGLARTRESWGIEGASFGEQIGSSGLPLGSHYGWEPPFGDRDPSKEVGVANAHATYYTTQLEMGFMMHEYRRYTGGDLRAYVPLLEQVVIFHFEYFKMMQRRRNGKDWDARGLLVIDPSHALETYRGRNATDVICALRVNLQGLLSLPDEQLPEARKAVYRDWLDRLPPINTREMAGHRVLSPLAGKVGGIGNYEIPQLYPVYPYGLYGLGLPDLALARDTWVHGVDPCLGKEPWIAPVEGDKPWYPSKTLWYGWAHQGAWLARLGLTTEAREYVTKKLDDARGNNDFDSAKRMRFPTFWGPGFDWTPDHNWGGSGMIMLQEMLLQTPGRRLLLLPTWPAEWDVDFRQHAPDGTIIECSYAKGRVEKVVTLPKAREADVLDWHARAEADEAPRAY